MTRSAETLPTSSELVLALQELGWQQSSEIPRLLSSWVSGQDEVVVPLDPSRGDFENLLNRALSTVETRHGVAGWQALRKVIQSTRQAFDVSRFLRETSTRGGIINWIDGRGLYDAAEQSLLAAARSARTPRKYHGSASSYLANNVLQSAFMGQPEQGGFVVTLLTQPNEQFAASKADERSRELQPEVGSTLGVSGRRVLQTLETALAGTRNALDEYRSTPQLDAFLELVSAGVSTELLRALATVTQDVSESAVTLDFAQEQSSARRAEFSFTAEESPILERASRRLLEDPEPQSATIVGSVTMVTRPRPGEHGVARIRVEAGADVKNVRVRIDPDQYADIVDAHRDDLKLEVSGRLERDRKYYWMYGTTGIRVLEPDDDIGDEDDQLQYDDDDDGSDE